MCTKELLLVKPWLISLSYIFLLISFFSFLAQGKGKMRTYWLKFVLQKCSSEVNASFATPHKPSRDFVFKDFVF